MVNLLEAIIMAGGPTQEAKLSDIRIIRSEQGNYSRVIRLNIEWYVEEASHDFFKLIPEDIVYIPRKKIWRETIVGTTILNIALPVAVSALIYQLIR